MRARVMSMAMEENSPTPFAPTRSIAISGSTSVMRSTDMAFWTVASR